MQSFSLRSLRRKTRFCCAHCGRTDLQQRNRRLCSPCYRDPVIRAAYPSNNTRVQSNHNRNLPLPGEPTQAMPGSREKIAVMKARAQRGEQIFHPDDALGPRREALLHYARRRHH